MDNLLKPGFCGEQLVFLFLSTVFSSSFPSAHPPCRMIYPQPLYLVPPLCFIRIFPVISFDQPYAPLSPIYPPGEASLLVLTIRVRAVPTADTVQQTYTFPRLPSQSSRDALNSIRGPGAPRTGIRSGGYHQEKDSAGSSINGNSDRPSQPCAL